MGELLGGRGGRRAGVGHGGAGVGGSITSRESDHSKEAYFRGILLYLTGSRTRAFKPGFPLLETLGLFGGGSPTRGGHSSMRMG